MNPTRLITGTVLIISLLLSACQKDGELDDNLPVLGTCESVPFAGNLSQSVADNTYTYVTSRGGTIVMNQKNAFITITHKDYENFRLELWGTVEVNGETLYSANHENLNGKHIKDRNGNRRSIIFPDGAKMTMLTSGLYEPLVSVSIRDGDAYHHFNFSCKILEYSKASSKYAQGLDDAEADGETATFEITETGLLFSNIYIEDTSGNKIEKKVPLGELFRDQPKRIDDHYDDPKMKNT